MRSGNALPPHGNRLQPVQTAAGNAGMAIALFITGNSNDAEERADGFQDEAGKSLPGLAFHTGEIANNVRIHRSNRPKIRR